MRIVTRPDFDGVVCAALLHEVAEITEPTLWVEPNDMQKGLIDIREGDIIANLPFHPNCALWFDHHYTNRVDDPFEGDYRIAPSAAGVIYEYYHGTIRRNFDELVREADKIDSADLSEDEVLRPELYPYVLVSMTISGHDPEDEAYWNRLVDMLRSKPIHEIVRDPEVRERCGRVIEENREIKKLLLAHTSVEGHVSTTDFRGFERPPKGNRFLVYSLFPQAVVSIKVRNDTENPNRVIISVGHSIFNRRCNINIGKMLAEFGGGGHRGAGACTVPAEKADETLVRIQSILAQNGPND